MPIAMPKIKTNFIITRMKMLAPQKNCIILKNQPMTCSVSLLWKLLLMFLPGFQKMQKTFDGFVYNGMIFVIMFVVSNVGSVCIGDVLKMPVRLFEAPACPAGHTGAEVFGGQLVRSFTACPQRTIRSIIAHQQFPSDKSKGIELYPLVSADSKPMAQKVAEEEGHTTFYYFWGYTKHGFYRQWHSGFLLWLLFLFVLGVVLGER